MPLAPQNVEALEKAGGFILDQLVMAQAITPEQQHQILTQQSAIEQETGEKPFVGELLDTNGIDTRALKQPLLDLQASARALLHSHGEAAAAQRCEGAYGAIDLRAGVPDNKWTVADMESGDPAKEQTALLQTRLLQTKVLATAATEMEAQGIEVPASTITALRASQDAAREGFGAATQALRAAGQQPEALEAVHSTLPQPLPVVSQQEIHQGITDALSTMQGAGLLNTQQAETLLAQEAKRSNDISMVQARRQARSKISQPAQSAEQPATGHADAVLQQRARPQQSGGRGM